MLFPLDPSEAGHDGHSDGVFADCGRRSDTDPSVGRVDPDVQVFDLLAHQFYGQSGNVDPFSTHRAHG